MSNQVTEAFKKEFADNYIHVAQQNKSRLEGTVRVKDKIKGESKTINFLGERTMQPSNGRHGVTPLNHQVHNTRKVMLADYEDGDMVDKQDLIRIVDPKSDYVQAMVAGANRKKDDIIIAALGGDSFKPDNTAIALPAAQKIAVGATPVGLTKAKIIQARKMFRVNECDEENGEELFMLYSAQAMADILSDPTITTADQTAIQMIQNGTIKGTWMGFKWIPTERLPLASSVRLLYAYAKSGVALGVGEDVVTDVGEDPSHKFNYRLYARMTLGATRGEEKKVVEIACQE